jgi:predicted nucleotidyltransferase
MATRNPTQTLPAEITPRFLEELRAHGITQAFVFGSVVRGEARPDSDLDLLVTFDPPITLFERMDVADGLSHLCGRRVDLITSIDPVFVPYIEPTLVPLPL